MCSSDLEHDGNVKSFYFIVNIQYILSVIDAFYLRLEAIFKLFFIVLKLHAHHECDTLSNGNIVRNKINHFSHNTENVKLCNRGPGDDTGVDVQYGFRQFHS